MSDLRHPNLAALAVLLGAMRPEDDGNYTLFPAYRRENGYLTILCDHCGDWHRHGRGSGHRVAHCPDRNSPYWGPGYVIVEVGDLTPRVFKEGRMRGAVARKARRAERYPRARRGY